MTTQIKPPQEYWELSAQTYIFRDGAQTRPNVKPANFGEKQPHPSSRLYKIVGTRDIEDPYGKAFLKPSIAKDGHPVPTFDRATGITSWSGLETGNRALYLPYHFALDANYNFSNNTVSFLLRDEGVYWMTPQMVKRYLAGDPIQIKGTKRFLSVNDVREPTLFDALGEEWAL